jgi:hypothetical protein
MPETVDILQHVSSVMSVEIIQTIQPRILNMNVTRAAEIQLYSAGHFTKITHPHYCSIFHI